MSESETTARDPDAPTPAADATPGATLLRGGVELASAEAREQRCLELLGEGAVVVRVPVALARRVASSNASNTMRGRFPVSANVGNASA